jgi:hypothetical protein
MWHHIIEREHWEWFESFQSILDDGATFIREKSTKYTVEDCGASPEQREITTNHNFRHYLFFEFLMLFTLVFVSARRGVRAWCSFSTTVICLLSRLLT